MSGCIGTGYFDTQLIRGTSDFHKACEKNSVVGLCEFDYIECTMSRWVVRLFIFAVCLLVGIVSSPAPPSELGTSPGTVPVTDPVPEKPADAPVPSDKPKLIDPSDFRADFTTDPVVVQTEVVNFPKIGDVIIEAVEQVGHFPKIVFREGISKRIIFENAIKDKSQYLIPEGGYASDPFLRFTALRSAGSTLPYVMAVAATPGGSDCGFYAVVYGIANGKIARLSNGLIVTAVQGGFYFGKLNNRLGFGFVGWDFDWSDGAHYDQHRYWVTAYQLNGGRLIKVLHHLTRHKYDSDEGSRAPLEFGLQVTDQRQFIPKINEYLE
jgi:hypothetical protein